MTQHSIGRGPEISLAEVGDVAPAPVAPAGPADACARCGHPMSRHDAIALRYCQATHRTDPGRTCICRPAA
jgi:hypothetical protein